MQIYTFFDATGGVPRTDFNKLNKKSYLQNKKNQSKLRSHDFIFEDCEFFAQWIMKANSFLNNSKHQSTDGSSPLNSHAFLSIYTRSSK
jgi:hypothetical protein